MLQITFMPNKCENLDDNIFLRRHTLPNTTQEKRGILNITINIKKLNR